MDSAVTLYEPSMSESSLEINDKSKERVQDRFREIVMVKDSAFPPEHIAWLRGFERTPDTPLRQSYINGHVQPEVVANTPTIQIGIIFLEGADKPTVALAEMNRETRAILNQQTPEWRVATAATLLRKFEIGDDLSISQPDDSRRVLEKNKANEPLRQKLPWPSQSEQELPRPSGKRHSSTDAFQLVKRNIQDHALTIDSDSVHLIHGESVLTCEYDIVCTLIEIDLQSICNLLANFREIIHNGVRNMSSRDITMILDTMINDVRRLCIRSPTLFRMGTRSIIARSKNTRYGVNYGTVFATMTTSQGIRVFIERSVAYYTSLNDSRTDQETVRPKFLQMLVMLLSLLNDDDLTQIGSILENTFKIPGNRQGLELLILKVLPLTSINSKVFMEDLLAAMDIGARKIQLEDQTMQINRWRKLQIELAQDGYLLPVPVRPTDSFDELGNGNMEDWMNAMDMEDQQSPDFAHNDDMANGSYTNGGSSSQLPQSWLPAWPENDGVFDSTIFKHIQHCGVAKQQGNIQQDTIKAVNIVPHLDITSEDRENEYVAVFANGARYRVSADEPEYISAMKTMRYTLKEVDQDTIIELDIAEDVLNQPFIEAVKQHNQLVNQINLFLGGQKGRKSFSIRKSITVKFTRIEEPVLATRVWAELISPSGQRSRVAEAFKLGDRIVFRDDIIKSMNATLSRLKRNVERIQKEVPQYKVKDDDKEITRMQEAHVAKLLEALDVIKTLTVDAGARKTDLAKLNGPVLPTDPISTVIYTSFIQTSGEKPEWQAYASQLHADQARLFVRSKRLVVDEVYPGSIIKLEFHSSRLILSVQPLTSSAKAGGEDDLIPLEKGATILWLGYYIVHVDPAPTVKNGFEVLAYYRVLSQKREGTVRKGRNPAEAFQGSFLI